MPHSKHSSFPCRQNRTPQRARAISVAPGLGPRDTEALGPTQSLRF